MNKPFYNFVDRPANFENCNHWKVQLSNNGTAVWLNLDSQEEFVIGPGCTDKNADWVCYFFHANYNDSYYLGKSGLLTNGWIIFDEEQELEDGNAALYAESERQRIKANQPHCND